MEKLLPREKFKLELKDKLESLKNQLKLSDSISDVIKKCKEQDILDIEETLRKIWNLIPHPKPMNFISFK